MITQRLVAVLTGDLVKSRNLGSKRAATSTDFSKIIEECRKYLATKNCRLHYSGFYRGDSFQIALSDPRFALWLVIFLRGRLLQNRSQGIRFDVRLGVGLGTASSWVKGNIAASDGEGFQLSGKALDSLKSSKEKYRRLRICPPERHQDESLTVISACLDAMIQRWTPEQAAAMTLFLQEKTQDEISAELKIRQPAVQTRLQTAGHYAIREAYEFFSRLIDRWIIELDINNSKI